MSVCVSVCLYICVCLSVCASNAGPRQPTCGPKYNDLSVFLSVCVYVTACVSVLVMRVQGSLRVVLNTMIWPDMLVERSSKRSVRVSAIDADDGIKIYLIQVYHHTVL